MIKVSVTAILTIIFAICIPTRQNPTSEHKRLLKQYAFCRCFDYANGDTNYFVNKDISISVLREIASGPPDELFDKMDSFGRQAALNIKPSIIKDYDNGRAVIFGGFRFYDSKTLDSLIESYGVK